MRNCAYVLLKAILETAADDGLIRRNPCRIKGAGSDQSPERPVLTLPQIHSSTKAALIYLHSGEDRQQAIAQAVNDLAREALDTDG